MSEELKKELVQAALEMGASRAEIFDISKIVFDQRTLLKCFFGCPGGMPYCPSTKDASNSMLYSELIKKYKWGVILCTDDLHLGQKITLEIESKAFLAGKHFAFGATECANCKECAFESKKECLNPKNVRPPLYALGIDVYSTVRGLGWELNVVQKKGDPAKNITAVFVE